MPEQINVSAVFIRNEAGQVLTGRKRGTTSFMFPGGKPELGESPIDAAVREVSEELGVSLDPALLSIIGTFTAPAANEEGHNVQATVFEHPLVPISEPLAEIEQLRWIDPSAEVEELAPLLQDVVFPALLAGSRKIQSLAVFTGSASGKSPIYEQAAENFARTVAGSGRAIVYGGGRVGLMGTIADAARAAGGEVFGVMPQVLVDGELAHPGLTSLEVVPDMHARKHRMSELADGFVALPGGAGTLEELFEVWTWQQLGIHAKPVALLDVDGFWQPLLSMLDHMTDQGFLAPQFRDSLVVASEPQALLDALSSWQAPAAKWSAGSKN
ncbi:TIGR00730 family Rossman fold protein [Glutamicibacter sp. FBE19]|uniref:TIGR00730 family Rossman fold protein n=1 Tax=Glutamicibacter sp. FBE19 TaxID=2761534 RepID=UPI0018968C31|nr:TIGR00730 family Rossman fold protein [Glutamicibacter sp. FBE19]MBF6672047.1 TIGR00730 family Rossman fold protein [Glutamicibacter sp. FBE19]